jgi:hypothetical protein
MKLRDQISVDQISTHWTKTNVTESQIFDLRRKTKTEIETVNMNGSCIHIDDRGKIVLRDMKAFDNKKTIIHKSSKMNKMMNRSISFSGGGYNCVYHLGIVKYIFENPDLFHGVKYLGASGGAGIASLALCYGSDPNKLMIINDILEDIISIRGLNLKLSEQVEKYSGILEKYINENKFNLFIKRNNRCYISITDVSDILPKNVIMNNFESYEQYLESLRASACIPILLDDKIRTVDGKWCLDGGLSNNMPIIDESTLKISCLNYPLMRADIYPKNTCELRYSFISPEKKYIIDMFDLGYKDMELYMKNFKQRHQHDKNNEEIDQCIKCLIEDPLFVN